LGGSFKYLLVVVSHLTKWVKVLPLSSGTANGVVKVPLDSIIPQFGLLENIDSDNGNHFTANIIKEFTKTLGFKWEYQTPCYPSS
jgi:hypothetical protein